MRLIVLRASVAIEGRSVTLYERTFTLQEQGSPEAKDRFLQELKRVLPEGVTPLIVTDAGYKNPWFKSIEKLGWYWLGRVRGNVTFAASDGL